MVTGLTIYPVPPLQVLRTHQSPDACGEGGSTITVDMQENRPATDECAVYCR